MPGGRSFESRPAGTVPKGNPEVLCFAQIEDTQNPRGSIFVEKAEFCAFSICNPLSLLLTYSCLYFEHVPQKNRVVIPPQPARPVVLFRILLHRVEVSSLAPHSSTKPRQCEMSAKRSSTPVRVLLAKRELSPAAGGFFERRPCPRFCRGQSHSPSRLSWPLGADLKLLPFFDLLFISDVRSSPLL